MLAIMTEFTGDKQRPAHLFAPGTSGNPNGRPRGARSKFSELFISDLHTVWETHGLAALEKCAVDEPGQFLRVCAMLMPRDISVTFGVNPAEFVKTFRDARAALGNEPPPPRLRRPLPGRVIDHAG
jgi:Family of unknown function (DUF5681)